MRVQYDVMVQEFARVLEKKGFTHEDAENAAIIFAQNSLAGVYSHGLNRFPRVVSYLEKGEIDPNARATCEMKMGAIERWDGHRGFGPLNAKRAMDRACELAKENGLVGPAVAEPTWNLARVYRALGDEEKEDIYLKPAVEGFRECYPPEHPKRIAAEQRLKERQGE